MNRDPLAPVVRFVTDHNRIVVLVMLLVSVGVVGGISDLKMESEAGNGNFTGDTTVAKKADYIRAHYGGNDSEEGPSFEPVAVYVRDENGNVLSKASLLASLRFQREVKKNDSLAAALPEKGGVLGVANAVAKRLAGDPTASLSAQIDALEAAGPSEVKTAVKETLAHRVVADRFMPSEYEPGTATANSRRMIFRLQPDESGEVSSAATRALFEAANERTDPSYFTVGEHAGDEIRRQAMQDTTELIIPVALVVILAVLAFAYRDLVDVIVGFAGVILSVLWMFGILGWLGVAAGFTLIIGPVLIVGLSVDYGLHVFMRYREQRGEEEGIREPMFRSLSAVAVALGLVTITTAVGFLSNLTNEFAVIRDLAVGITLGVISAFVIFVTLVPALKVSVDGLLERFGLDRRKQPLGKTGLLRRFLESSVTLARKAAPAVLVLALLAGAAGATAWTGLERQGFQQDTDGVAEWKRDLPKPFAWEVTRFERQAEFVDRHFRNADESSRRFSQILIEGDVTDPATLARIDEATAQLAGRDVVFTRDGSTNFITPISVMEAVAKRDESFARVLQEADTDGDPLPDRNLEAVYDALYGAAPQQARRVIERTGGKYRSVRVIVPIKDSATYSRQADVMRAAADVIDGDGLTATAVGSGTFSEAELAQTANNILKTLLIALASIAVMLALVYRLVTGSATLGVLTVLPIGLVTALVVGGMYVFGVPLTLLTALLMSLVIGVGIDYNIHISDRFAQELDRGRDPISALTEAVTGTGGALLGSTLTTTGSFSALLLHPHPQLQSFGSLVVLALSLSFVVSVFVLPSLLLAWTQYRPSSVPEPPSSAVADD